MRRPIPPCPSCGQTMEVTGLACPHCGTAVTGRFAPSWKELSAEQVEFARRFVALRGNLKEMERTLGVSYGTLRARLDAVAERLSAAGLTVNRTLSSRSPAANSSVEDVLKQLEQGEIDAAEAHRRITGRAAEGGGESDEPGPQ